LLAVENWYEREWFVAHREKLKGTSAVYKVPTKNVDGEQLMLVVKNCRVGEDVPVETRTLFEFINAEFNSPWEEFALVMEMREGKCGPPETRIETQLPLAIYVPPGTMQPWQSGRSYEKINKIHARHPGIDLDILRQYKLIYRWIDGQDIVECFADAGVGPADLPKHLGAVTAKVVDDMAQKGFAVADMKPDHIIIGEDSVNQLHSLPGDESGGVQRRINLLHALVEQRDYAVIDYELLIRTVANEEQTIRGRRHSYLAEMRDRFTPATFPAHLKPVEIFGVPYVYGVAESTGGQLYVVGCHPNLFDYFLPERWRRTPSWKLSLRSEIFYTVTKDNIHIVWRTSRVGELPADSPDARVGKIAEFGFNSPFEEIAIADYLSKNGVPSVYMRAIYRTGSSKLVEYSDSSRFDSHADILAPDGAPVLCPDHDYITIRGYFNGPDHWVAEQNGPLYRPLDLMQAVTNAIITKEEKKQLFDIVRQRLKNIGFDGSLLEANDMLLAISRNGEFLRDEEGKPEVRICNFELIRKV